ncbi:MAG TPA: MFS transporter [Solirubrobacterales bacterium]|nr:MFS transporter [Solirubrobacterales bacterium]
MRLFGRGNDGDDRDGQGRPLDYPAFRAALASRVISGLGTWMQIVAAGWLVFDITGSAAAVGVLTVAVKGPGLLFSTYGGELADRYDRRRIVVISSAVSAIFAGLLAVLAWESPSTPLVVYLPALVLGISSSIGNASKTAVVMGTVPKELLASATGMSSVAYNLCRLIGPVIGGLLVVAVGPGPCFALNGLSYVAVALLVARLPTTAAGSGQASTSVREAVRIAAGDPRLRGFFLATVAFSLLIAPIQEIAPAIAKEHGDGAHLLGFMLAALAAGGLTGNWLRTKLAPRFSVQRLLGLAIMAGVIPLAALGGVCAAGTATLGDGGDFALAVLVMFSLGIGWEILYITTLSGVQLVRTDVSGVMTGFYYTLVLGGLSIGALGLGALIDTIELGGGLLVAAGLLAVIGFYMLRESNEPETT